jgi:hypothetical protein
MGGWMSKLPFVWLNGRENPDFSVLV